jgi:hypothetical protein
VRGYRFARFLDSSAGQDPMADLDRHERSPRTPTVLVLLLAAAAACPDACRSPPVAARIVGPQGGEVATADGAVRLEIPSGALAMETEISIQAVNVTPASIPGGVEGTAYEFRPDGLTFARPARLTIRYSPARLPIGAAESALALASVQDDGRLQLTPELHVDEVARTVTGSITGFSGYAAVTPCTWPGWTFEAPEPHPEHLLPGDFRFCAGPRGARARIDGWIPEEEPP